LLCKLIFYVNSVALSRKNSSNLEFNLETNVNKIRTVTISMRDIIYINYTTKQVYNHLRITT